MLPVSILDLAPIVEGGLGDALRNSSTSRVTPNAGDTSGTGSPSTTTWPYRERRNGGRDRTRRRGDATIRVGAGGIMLPNHSPLVIAEQFGTLAALHPEDRPRARRAPGTDQLTFLALRRARGADSFPQDVLELQALLGDPRPGQAVHAVPGMGRTCPSGSWARASSALSSRPRSVCPTPSRRTSPRRASAGPRSLSRSQFRPSEQLEQPYAMVAANVIAADDDQEARRLFTSFSSRSRISFAAAGTTPASDRRHRVVLVTGGEVARVGMLRRSFVGSAETVEAGPGASWTRPVPTS